MLSFAKTLIIPPKGTSRPTRGELLRWNGWFFLANSIIALLIALRYLSVVQYPTGELTVTFTVLAYIGHFVSLGFIGTLLLALPIIVLPRRSIIFTLAITLAILFIIGITLDTFVFQQYRFHFNGMVLNLLLGGAAEEIFTFSSTLWLILIGFLLTLFLFELWLAQRIWLFVRATPNHKFGYVIGISLFAIFLAENILYAWADAENYTPITKQIRFLPAYKPLTADRWFIENGFANPEENDSLALLSASTNNNSSLNYPGAALNCSTQNKPLNIVYILIDSWRYDSLTKEATPNIYAFAKKAQVFENHYSGANSTRTGLFSFFYGLPGTYWHAMLAENRGAVFINQLIKQNYQMGIFASAKLYSPEFDRTIFAQVKNLRVESKGRSPHERDQNIRDDFFSFVDKHISSPAASTPFFSFLFFDSPHSYAFPKNYPITFKPSWDSVNYLALNNDFDATPFFNRYRNSVHFVDSLIGQVIHKLKKTGLLNNTVIVISGDHGQEFNDNKLNFWGHNSNFSSYQTRVPLVIHWPGKQPQHFTHQTSHFDIAPTIMSEFLGCKSAPDTYSSGKHLINGKPVEYLILSNYNQFAILEKERITVVNEFGNVDILNHQYQPIPGAVLPRKLMLSVMNEMSRFYTK